MITFQYRCRPTLLVGGLLATVFFCSGVCGLADESIEFKALPETVQRALSEVHVDEVEKEVEDGAINYEVTIEGDGVEIEIEVDQQGRLLGIEITRDDEDADDQEDGKDEADDDEEDGNDDDGEDDANGDASSVPGAARRALQQLASGAELEGFEKDTHDGQQLYEAGWTQDGIHHEAAVTADGVLVELEEAVALSDVPEAVRKTAMAAFPAASNLKYERKLVAVYEIEVESEDEEVIVSPFGRQMQEDDED